ncbi:MAG: 3-hydroxybutyryl-CoA dehydrogenase [Actinomycetota bacterium]
MEITKVAVIGGGTMGSGIAEISAKAGVDTIVMEADAAAAEAAQGRISGSMDKAVARERLSADDRDAAAGLLSYTTDIEALSDRDLVIEAIVENEAIKLDLFARLDAITPEHAILASNTSSIPLINLATATNRPGQVLGLHFFNPATVQKLCEIVVSIATDDGVLASAKAFAEDTLGKSTIIAQDRAGFIVNRLLVPYLLQAIALYDTGQASREDIDNGMMFGCAHPMGPLTLCDLIGLDTIKSVADVLYEEFKEPTYAPPPLLKRMVAGGQLGRKTGAGFYSY